MTNEPKDQPIAEPTMIHDFQLGIKGARKLALEILRQAEISYLLREANDHAHRALVPVIMRKTALAASQIYDTMPDVLMDISNMTALLAQATVKLGDVKSERARLIALAYEEGAVTAKNEAARKAQLLMIVPMRPVDQAVEALFLARTAYDVALLQLDGLKEGRRALETQINAYNIAIEYEKALGGF